MASSFLMNGLISKLTSTQLLKKKTVTGIFFMAAFVSGMCLKSRLSNELFYWQILMGSGEMLKWPD